MIFVGSKSSSREETLYYNMGRQSRLACFQKSKKSKHRVQFALAGTSSHFVCVVSEDLGNQ
jgi:hypothetical protein